MDSWSSRCTSRTARSARAVVVDSQLPSLERLTVSLGGVAHCVLDEIYAHDDDGGYPDTFSADDLGNLDVHRVGGGRISNDALRGFLEALPPLLVDLSFTSSVLGEPLLDALAWHPRVAQLRSLDLSACTITDQTVGRLLERAAALARIGVIDLSRNTFSAATRRAITRALPNAVLGESQWDPDFFMRYVATME